MSENAARRQPFEQPGVIVLTFQQVKGELAHVRAHQLSLVDQLQHASNVIRRRVVLFARSKIHHTAVEHGLREADFARILVHGRHSDRIDNQISGNIVAILNHVSGKLAIRIRPSSARRLDNARTSHYIRRAHGSPISPA